MLKKSHILYKYIELFQTKLIMAQQTNFAKPSLLQTEKLNFWLPKPILLYEIQRQTSTDANRRSIHFWATLCEQTKNSKAK